LYDVTNRMIDEETKEEDDSVHIERPYCQECCPLKNHPHMYIVLLGDNIFLNDRTTHDHPTHITRTSHPLSLLHSINQKPGYQHFATHKHLFVSKQWNYKLIIGPLPLQDFPTTKEIEKLEQEWEKNARKILTRMIWGIQWWLSHSSSSSNMMCYIDQIDEFVITNLLYHQHKSSGNLKVLYDELFNSSSSFSLGTSGGGL
jgi:hypothetical protein